MAVYGYNNGTLPFTGFTPTLGVSDAVTASTSGAVQNLGLSGNDGHISRLFFPQAHKAVKALLIALIGAAPGGTALAQYNRVAGVQALTDAYDLGGLVTIETVTAVNRATTAADVTNLKAMFTRSPQPSSYYPDASGNGGGGKAGW
jgi:hypothetical protein